CWLQRHAKYTMSDEMVRAVARSLDLYLRVRRLEEGFDLSSVGAVGVTGGGGGGYGSVISSRRLHDKPVKMQFRNPLTRCQVESMSGALSGQPANDSTEKSKTSSSSRSRSAVRLRHRLDIVEATTALTTPRRTRGRVHHRQRQRMSTRGGDDSDDENQRNRLIDNASAILDLLAPPARPGAEHRAEHRGRRVDRDAETREENSEQEENDKEGQKLLNSRRRLSIELPTGSYGN
ncbi:hypothetical protein BOX15_Mlig033758g5, partial [Macrostomum lignano]